jgi:hypothetical protein
MAGRYELKDFDGILEELDHESHRAAIMVGGSLVEHALEKMIRSKLRKPENSQQKEALFNDTGIFGSFHQKIWAAYFLKWIGPLTRRDLDLIRSIRNIVAHDMNPVSFDTPEIANRCSELFAAKDSVAAQQRPTDLRGMLMLGVKFYTGALLLKAVEHEQDVVDLKVVKYLDR